MIGIRGSTRWKGPPMLVRDAMTPKPMTISMDATLDDARVTLHELGVHHLLVVDQGVLVGVVSDRDVLRNISPFVGQTSERPQDVAVERRRVHQFMTRRPVTVGPDADLFGAARMLQEGRFSCLPVVDEGQRPVGILTVRDLLTYALRHLEQCRGGAGSAAA